MSDLITIPKRPRGRPSTKVNAQFEAEAARKYPKSLPTYRRWVREGRLQAYKHGRDLYLREADLTPKPVNGPVRRAAQK